MGRSALQDVQILAIRQGPFLEAIEKAGAVRTLESLARIELGAQGGAPPQPARDRAGRALCAETTPDSVDFPPR